MRQNVDQQIRSIASHCKCGNFYQSEYSERKHNVVAVSAQQQSSGNQIGSELQKSCHSILFNHIGVWLKKKTTKMTGKQKMSTTIINEGSQANDEENHSKHDLQKFLLENDKVGREHILDTYAMHRLQVGRICKLLPSK